MPIVNTDLKYRLSGGAANTSPAASLGGAISTAAGGVITSASLNNLFDNVSGSEAAAGTVEHRCIYIKNEHASLALTLAKLWIQTQDPHAGVTFAIALAGEGKNVSAETIANEAAAPVGETFTSPTTKGSGLSLADLSATDYQGFWVRRTVTAGAAATASTGPTLRVEGDTPA